MFIDVSLSQEAEVDSTLLTLARALADQTRMCILAALRECGELSCGELVERCSVAQSTVSHHLKTLTECDLVVVREDGQRNLYRVRREASLDLVTRIAALLGPRRRTLTDPAHGLPDLGPGIVD